MRIRATELPTVPKPSTATFIGGLPPDFVGGKVLSSGEAEGFIGLSCYGFLRSFAELLPIGLVLPLPRLRLVGGPSDATAAMAVFPLKNLR